MWFVIEAWGSEATNPKPEKKDLYGSSQMGSDGYINSTEGGLLYFYNFAYFNSLTISFVNYKSIKLKKNLPWFSAPALWMLDTGHSFQDSISSLIYVSPFHSCVI